MKSRKPLCILFIAVTIAATLGCVAQEKGDSNSLKKYLPQGNSLPEGYKLIVIEDESIEGLNMTKEIIDFCSPKEIGPVNATLARYDQESFGFFGDAVVTILSLQDEEHAKAAISNYLFNFNKSGNPTTIPSLNVSLINPATINNHEVTEIGKITGDYRIRYLYLWNNKSLAVLVEGNTDKDASKALASATSL